VLADALDTELERVGGGLVMIEQFAISLDIMSGAAEAGRNVYIRPAGGSEGYGIGGAIGVKLAAPDRAVAGLVGDGSMFYAGVLLDGIHPVKIAEGFRLEGICVEDETRAYQAIEDGLKVTGRGM
jgi:thiamine pyrophosphate-dependent acetolactate synthase large subunit-like protein